MSQFLNFFSNLTSKLQRQPTELDAYISDLNNQYGTDVIDFISQKPPQAQAPMVDSADLMRQTNAMAGVNNPAMAMLQSNAQAAPTTPQLSTFNPLSSVGALEEPTESEEAKQIRESYEAVADKQAFLQNRQRQPFNFYG